MTATRETALRMTPPRRRADSHTSRREFPEQVFDNPTGWVADHIRRYVESGGTRGHRFNGHDALLLTTRGRRTGKLRRTALYYGRHGDHYVLVATPARSGADPAWYLNVLDNPAVVLQVRVDVFAALARPATPDERPRLWSLMLSVFPKYASYERAAGRNLPVVVVERAAEAALSQTT
jgi:deazaflavin-dependent oxidoreductase (nitroreductase family)